MSGPRDYTAGTERALFRLARGTCYYPDCMAPIIRVVDGEAIVAVEIAHIRGALPDSARYDTAMTDEQRRAFANLLLLCTAHHKVVDRLKPVEHPPELLEQWKHDNEGSGLDELLRLESASESNLERLIIEAVAHLQPTRSVEADLRAGVLVSPGTASTSPFDVHATLLELNSHLRQLPDVVVVDVRNIGALPVQVDSIDLHWNFRLHDQDDQLAFTLMGRNDFAVLNPRLPHRVLDGAAVHWLVSGDTVRATAALYDGHRLDSIHAVVRLGTGENIETERIRWDQVAAAGFGAVRGRE